MSEPESQSTSDKPSMMSPEDRKRLDELDKKSGKIARSMIESLRKQSGPEAKKEGTPDPQARDPLDTQ
jgi:hypothetical protein